MRMGPYTRFPLWVIERRFRSDPFIHADDQLTGQEEVEARAEPTG